MPPSSLLHVTIPFSLWWSFALIGWFLDEASAWPLAEFTRCSTAPFSKRASLSSRVDRCSSRGGFDVGLRRLSASSLPRDVKEAVSSCRESVQRALQAKISRMTIDFPVGTKFGVEKDEARNKSRKFDGIRGDIGGPTRQDLERSDRELARLFVEMFQPVGGERLVVAFNEAGLANLARKKWTEDPTASCQVLSLNRSGRKGEVRKKKPVGFAAKLAAEVDDAGEGPFRLPEMTEVVIFVAPGPRDLVRVEKVCNEVGMGTLVILVNARLMDARSFGSASAARLYEAEFETVFLLAAAPQEDAPGCLLYRAYPNDWSLGRKPKIGPPKTIMSSSERPTNEECRSAFATLAFSDFEKGLESTVNSVSSWFR